MNVPNDHPELRAFLAAMLKGDGSGPALTDWLEERGDDRAAKLRFPITCVDQEHFERLYGMFDVLPCQTCSLDRPGLPAYQNEGGWWLNAAIGSCKECGGLGWSQQITSVAVPASRLPRRRAVDPRRVPLV